MGVRDGERGIFTPDPLPRLDAPRDRVKASARCDYDAWGADFGETGAGCLNDEASHRRAAHGSVE